MSDLVNRLRSPEGMDWRTADRTMKEAADALAAQAKEIEALRKDAERYRWLRTPGQQQDFVCGVAWGTPEEMDAAIDAAKGE